MRTPFCFVAAGALLVGALVLGNPFLAGARAPRIPLRAGPAGPARTVADTHQAPSAAPASSGLAAPGPAERPPAAAEAKPAAAPVPANSGRLEAGLQPAVLIGSVGGGSVVGEGSPRLQPAGPGPGPEFDGLVERVELAADGHPQWLLKDGRVLRRLGNRIVEVPRDGLRR